MDASTLGKQLSEWAKKMNYYPPPGTPFPDDSVFQQLCKGKTIPLWQEVLKSVRPAKEVEHMQKVILLHRLNAAKAAGKPVTLDSIALPQGHIGKKLQLQKLIEIERKKQDQTRARICALEETIKNQREFLLKSAAKLKHRELEKDEFKRKMVVLKLKKLQVERKISVIRDFTRTTESLCPPMNDTKEKPPTVVVQDCLEALQKFHSSKQKEADQDRQNRLWKTVISCTDGLTAQSLWAAILESMDQLNSDISSAIASSPLGKFNNHSKLLNSMGPSSDEQLSLLCGSYLTTFMELSHLKAQVHLKNKECDSLIKSHAAKSSSEENKSDVCKDSILLWAMLKCRKAKLCATYEKLISEASALESKLPDFAKISSELQECRETLSKLENDMVSRKRHIEAGLFIFSHTPNDLKIAKEKVAERLKNFRSKYQQFKDKLNDDIRMPPSFPLSSPFLDVKDDHCRPLSSTLIGNITASSNISLNMSFSSSSSASLETDSGFSWYVSVLKHSVSTEAKKFVKLDLKMIPSVMIKGDRVPECQLIVEGPSQIMVSVLSSKELSFQQSLQFVPGAPVSDAVTVILTHLRELSHHRALSIIQLLNVSKEDHIPLCAQLDLEALIVHSVQEESLEIRLKDIDVMLDVLHINLSACKEMFDMWSKRVIQEAVPPSLLVKGKPFSVWRKQYEEALKKHSIS